MLSAAKHLFSPSAMFSLKRERTGVAGEEILRFAQNDRESGLAGGLAPVGFAPEVER